MQRPKFKEILKGKELLCNWKMVKESKFKKEKSKLKMEFVWITSNRDWMYRKHDWYQNMPNKLHVPFYSLLPTCHSLSLSLSLSPLLFLLACADIFDHLFLTFTLLNFFWLKIKVWFGSNTNYQINMYVLSCLTCFIIPFHRFSFPFHFNAHFYSFNCSHQ